MCYPPSGCHMCLTHCCWPCVHPGSTFFFHVQDLQYIHGGNVSALIPLVSSTGFPISGSHDIYLHIFLCCCHWHASFGHGEYFSILVSNAVSLTENSAIISFWVLMVLDLFQPKISPTLSFSGMQQKLFIYHSSLATGPRIFSNLNYHARLGPL